MGKYLILVKHSLPQIIDHVPAREWRLSEEGQVRALHLSERLKQYQPEVIVSSMEPKAQETAEIIARKNNLEFHIVDGLHEHDRSKTSFLAKDEFEIAIREFFENPDVLVFGSETANQCYMRFHRAVYSVLNNHGSKTIVIVTHGTVLSLFVSRFAGISGLDLWNELGLPSFVILDMESSTLVERVNIL